MNWASTEADLKFYRNLEERGMVKPDAKKPEVDAFKFYIDAFTELGTCRSVGMGEGPIPFTSIAEYAKIYKIEQGEEFFEFLYFIRAMDSEYLKVRTKDAKDSTPKPKKTKGRK